MNGIHQLGMAMDPIVESRRLLLVPSCIKSNAVMVAAAVVVAAAAAARVVLSVAARGVLLVAMVAPAHEGPLLISFDLVAVGA